MLRWMVRLVSHGVALVVGFALGVYLLPILTEPEGPDRAMLEQTAQRALYSAEFVRDLKGSDFLHWGEGRLSVAPDRIVHDGKLSPGPDYKLYLLKQFVDDEAGFAATRSEGVRIGDVKTFSGFILEVPAGVNVEDYTTAVVWCETFSEFITAARYR